MEVDLTNNDGTTYVAIMYGHKTDYTAQIIGMGSSTENLTAGVTPGQCSVAITRLARADSLGDCVGMF